MGGVMPSDGALQCEVHNCAAVKLPAPVCNMHPCEDLGPQHPVLLAYSLRAFNPAVDHDLSTPSLCTTHCP